MDFRIVGGLNGVTTVRAPKANGVVIEAGDVVTLNNGSVIKGVAASTALAYAPNGAASADLECEITVGNNFELVGLNDADAAFAADQRGDLCDLKGTTTLIIDNDTSSTNVFQICGDVDNGTVGSKAGIRVKINKPVLI